MPEDVIHAVWLKLLHASGGSGGMLISKENRRNLDTSSITKLTECHLELNLRPHLEDRVKRSWLWHSLKFSCSLALCWCKTTHRLLSPLRLGQWVTWCVLRCVSIWDHLWMTGIGRSSCFDHTWCRLLTGFCSVCLKQILNRSNLDHFSWCVTCKVLYFNFLLWCLISCNILHVAALLAAAAPDQAPFMADECLMAIPEIEGIDYTTKEYLKFVQHIQTTVERLNKESEYWTVSLFVIHVFRSGHHCDFSSMGWCLG